MPVVDLATMDEAERAEFQRKFRRKKPKRRDQANPGKSGSSSDK
jgi:hypothetical protein